MNDTAEGTKGSESNH